MELFFYCFLCAQSSASDPMQFPLTQYVSTITQENDKHRLMLVHVQKGGYSSIPEEGLHNEVVFVRELPVYPSSHFKGKGLLNLSLSLKKFLNCCVTKIASSLTQKKVALGLHRDCWYVGLCCEEFNHFPLSYRSLQFTRKACSYTNLALPACRGKLLKSMHDFFLLLPRFPVTFDADNISFGEIFQ